MITSISSTINVKARSCTVYNPLLSSLFNRTSRRVLGTTVVNNNQFPRSKKRSSPNTNKTVIKNNRGIKTKSSFPGYYALPFTISPDEALNKFYKWSDTEQGIKILVSNQKTLISASFVPFWSFDLNLRFSRADGNNKRVRYDISKPEPFSVYKNDVAYVPGLSCYAGYDYRRSLVDPIHNTSLVYLHDDVARFESWMLRPMKLSNGVTLDVGIDAWNTTKGRSMELLLESLQDLDSNCKVEAQLMKSRRVYMPTYVISYSILGVEYQAFCSGADLASEVSGVSHAVWSSSTATTVQSTFLKNASQFTRRMESTTLYFWILSPILKFFFRAISRFPVIAAIMASFMTFRKLIYPFLVNQSSSADWERQRDHEAQMSDNTHTFHHWTDFVDDGTAYSYFTRNKQYILTYFSQGNVHSQGDWFSQWVHDQWSQYDEKPYQQQYQQKRTSKTQQQQKQTKRQQKPKKKSTYTWDFNPNDPYSVLGISRTNVTKEEVSKVFRTEMMKHHPDTNVNASPEEKERSTERAKLITDAYRKIKNDLK